MVCVSATHLCPASKSEQASAPTHNRSLPVVSLTLKAFSHLLTQVWPSAHSSGLPEAVPPCSASLSLSFLGSSRRTLDRTYWSGHHARVPTRMTGRTEDLFCILVYEVYSLPTVLVVRNVCKIRVYAGWAVAFWWLGLGTGGYRGGVLRRNRLHFNIFKFLPKYGVDRTITLVVATVRN